MFSMEALNLYLNVEFKLPCQMADSPRTAVNMIKQLFTQNMTYRLFLIQLLDGGNQVE